MFTKISSGQCSSSNNINHPKSKKYRNKKPNVNLTAFFSESDNAIDQSGKKTTMPCSSNLDVAWWKNIYRKPAAGHLGVHHVRDNGGDDDNVVVRGTGAGSGGGWSSTSSTAAAAVGRTSSS